MAYYGSAVQAAPKPSFSRSIETFLGDRDEDYGGCRCIEDVYERLSKIGEGTYGKVFLAKDIATGELVAAKKVILEQDKVEKREEGFPITAIREIKLLLELCHPNVINLREVVRSRAHPENRGLGSIYMIFDYMDHDLDGLTKQITDRNQPLTTPQIKCIARQILEGLAYCHEHHVIHRDLKPSNLLMNNFGQLKLADFGLARLFHPDIGYGRMTHGVVTLWYRSPELLLGDERYTESIDVWSAGCIIAELVLRKKFIQGKDELSQIGLIMEVFGGITSVNFPGCEALPFYKNINPSTYTRPRFRELFNREHPDAISLIEQMLAIDPKKRISAREALSHPFFRSDPLPCRPEGLPKMEASHEWTTKRKDQRDRQRAGEAAKRPRHIEGAVMPRGAGRGRYGDYVDLDDQL